jgi:hypothetical protein
MLFLGNKQAAQALSAVSLVLSAPSPAVQVVLGQPPAQLSPKQQVQVCVAPGVQAAT